MASTKIDARQVISRDTLQQLAPYATDKEVDDLLRSINSDTTSPLKLDASNPADRTINVGPAIVSNAESNRQKTIPHIGSLLPNDFTSGTVVFPSASGGAITVTPGNDNTLTVTSNNYIKVLIYMDVNGDLNVLPGIENAVEVDATVLPAPSGSLPIGYVTLFNNAGTIDTIIQSKIFQFGSGAGGGSGGGDGVLEPAPGFQALEIDDFSELPSSADSKVDSSTSATHSVADAMFELKCDKTRSMSTTGTSYFLNGATTGFTLAVGDIIWHNAGSVWRKVVGITNATSGTLDAVFPVDLILTPVMISQAVHTKDIVNLGDASQKTRPRDFFSGNVSPIFVDYQDSLDSGDEIADFTDEARVVFAASNYGDIDDVGFPNSYRFEPIFARPQAPAQIDNYILPSTTLDLVPEVIEENQITDSEVSTNSVLMRGQSFTWNSSKSLHSVTGYMRTTDSTATGNMVLKVNTIGSAGKIYNSVIATSDPVDVTTVGNSIVPVTFTFSTPLILSQGVSYGLYFDNTSLTFNTDTIEYEINSSGNVYSDGSSQFTSDAGVTWTVLTGNDLRFQALGIDSKTGVAEENLATGVTTAIGTSFANQLKGQTFIWNSDKLLDSIIIQMVTSLGTMSGNMTVDIYETNSTGVITGSPIAVSSTLDVSTVPGIGSPVPPDMPHFTFTFSTPVDLVEGRKYGVSFNTASLTFNSNFITFTGETPGNYSNGSAQISNDSGVSWSNNSADFKFTTIGTSPDQERLHQTFFCNPNNASVTDQANLIKYETSFYDEPTIESGGILEDAYCMSDSSATARQCTPSVVSSKTRVSLDNWSYVPGVNSGGTKGQLSIFVDGLEIPRFVSGTTVDAYYIEIDSSNIEFHTDLSGSPLSIKVLKSEGVVDTNNQNTTHINAVNGIFVGNQAQVDAGVATYTTIQAAINGANNGDVITILGGTFDENLTIDKSVMIKGIGRKTIISGTVSFDSGSDFSSLRMVRVTDNITINTDGSFLTEMWLATAKSISDFGTGNSINVVGE